jgi:hypothetical protein
MFAELSLFEGLLQPQSGLHKEKKPTIMAFIITLKQKEAVMTRVMRKEQTGHATSSCLKPH